MSETSHQNPYAPPRPQTQTIGALVETLQMQSVENSDLKFEVELCENGLRVRQLNVDVVVDERLRDDKKTLLTRSLILGYTLHLLGKPPLKLTGNDYAIGRLMRWMGIYSPKVLSNSLRRHSIWALILGAVYCVTSVPTEGYELDIPDMILGCALLFGAALSRFRPRRSVFLLLGFLWALVGTGIFTWNSSTPISWFDAVCGFLLLLYAYSVAKEYGTFDPAIIEAAEQSPVPADISKG